MAILEIFILSIAAMGWAKIYTESLPIWRKNLAQRFSLQIQESLFASFD